MGGNSSSGDEYVSIEDKGEYSVTVEMIDPFSETMELIEEHADEFDHELFEAIAEVEGTKSFQCEKCPKICKSKGGLTRHTRSKHPEGDVAESSKTSKAENKAYFPAVDLALLENFFKEIVEKLRDEKFYPEEILAVASSVKPGKEFLAFVNETFGKFCRKRNQDALLAMFYKEIYNKWKSFFPSCKDQRAINLVLIHLPQKLVAYRKQAISIVNGEEESEEIKINPEELGPLSYVAGYVLRALYTKSKNSPHWNSTHAIELQSLLKSVKEDTEDDEYMESISRGGLWTPNEHIKCIAENAEYVFRKHLSFGKTSVTTTIPTDKMVDEILGLPVVISIWDNVTTDLDQSVSNECKKLTLENFVKLFVRVRSFSYAKDIVNRYKVKEKTSKTKALRTELKKKAK